MMNYTANLHSSADSFYNIPFSCRSFLVPGFCNQVVYLVIFSARDVHGWKAQEKTSVHIKGERSGRWKTESTVSLRLGFIFIAAWQSFWLLIISVGGNVVGLALDKLMGNLYSKLVFGPALFWAKVRHPKLITTYMTGCNLLTGRGGKKSW